jgi:hypothetical protein
MQTETAIIIAGIVLVFAVFIVVLAWAQLPRTGRSVFSRA